MDRSGLAYRLYPCISVLLQIAVPAEGSCQVPGKLLPNWGSLRKRSGIALWLGQDRRDGNTARLAPKGCGVAGIKSQRRLDQIFGFRQVSAVLL